MKKRFRKIVAILCCVPLIMPIKVNLTKFKIKKNIKIEEIKNLNFRKVLKEKMEEYIIKEEAKKEVSLALEIEESAKIAVNEQPVLDEEDREY